MNYIEVYLNFNHNYNLIFFGTKEKNYIFLIMFNPPIHSGLGQVRICLIR